MLLRRLLLLVVLVVELRVHVVVLELILEVLQMLPLLVVAELLRGGRRGSVLAHDAAAGSLWVVDEGGHHGGGTKWGDREA